MDRSTKALPVDQMFVAFEGAVHTLWMRAHRTLGGVTLTAIVDRVLHMAARKYPIFADVEITPTGIGVPASQRADNLISQEGAHEAIRFVLVELLTVLGNLTAQILTPALHIELSRAGKDPGEPVEDRHVGDANRERSDDESSKP